MNTYKRQPCSPETKAKIGAANRGRYVGRKLSEETKVRMSVAKKSQWAKLKGDKQRLGANWKGGLNQNQRTDSRVFAWKEGILIRDDYTCQVCQARGVFLHIDHIQPWADYPELRFEVSNGRALCRPCHYYVTFKRKMPHGSKWGVGIKDLS